MATAIGKDDDGGGEWQKEEEEAEDSWRLDLTLAETKR